MFSLDRALAMARLARMPVLCAVLPLLFCAQAAPAQDLTLSDALTRVASGDPVVAANVAQLQAAKAAIA